MYLWRESPLGMPGFPAIGPAPVGTCWVDLADRGADNFEAMQAARALGHHFLFRLTKDRNVRLGPRPTDKAAPAKRLARS